MILIFLLLINGEYICNFKVNTLYNSTKELINVIDTPYFLNSYIKRVRGSDINYDPLIENNTFQYPQNVSYYFVPNINFIPSFLLKKIKVKHNWNKFNNTLYGNVNSDYLNFNITLEPLEINNTIYLNISGHLIDKKSFLPNNILDHMLNEFKNIFKFIINNQ